MHFGISIPLVSNITLMVAKTSSWHTVLNVQKREKQYEIPHKALRSWIQR